MENIVDLEIKEKINRQKRTTENKQTNAQNRWAWEVVCLWLHVVLCLMFVSFCVFFAIYVLLFGSFSFYPWGNINNKK